MINPGSSPLFTAAASRELSGASPAKTSASPAKISASSSTVGRIHGVGVGTIPAPSTPPPPVHVPGAFPAVTRAPAQPFPRIAPTPPSTTSTGSSGSQTALQSPHVLGAEARPLFSAAPKR